MTFLLAKQRTLHVFSDNGKSIQVSLRERDANIAVFAASEPIPVGVVVEWAGPVNGPVDATSGQVDCTKGRVLNCRPLPLPGDEKNLLEISVELKP